jgi:hypothetical protein
MPDDQNPGAALVRKRWDKTTADQRSEIARKLNEARWAGKTAEERAEQGKRAADARWGKARKKPVKKKKG